jgi:hypothetical protein
VEGDGADDGLGLHAQDATKAGGNMGVEQPVAAAADDDLWDDDGEGELGSLLVKGLEVAGERGDDGPVGRDDDLEPDVVPQTCQ